MSTDLVSHTYHVGHATQSSKHQSVLMHVLNEALALTDDESVGDFDLSLADAVPATVGGAFEEFIYAPRLDNLMSCYCALAVRNFSLPLCVCEG